MNSTTIDWTLTSLKTAVPLKPDASMSFDLHEHITILRHEARSEANRSKKINVLKVVILQFLQSIWQFNGVYH